MDYEQLEEYQDPSDQRYLPRWEVKNRATFKLDDDHNEYEAETKDLSCAGACIISMDKDASARQKIDLRIYLVPDEKPVELSGEIVWTKDDDGKICMGVDFQDLDVENQELILQHAFELNKKEVLKHWFKGWEGSDAT